MSSPVGANDQHDDNRRGSRRLVARFGPALLSVVVIAALALIYLPNSSGSPQGAGGAGAGASGNTASPRVLRILHKLDNKKYRAKVVKSSKTKGDLVNAGSGKFVVPKSSDNIPLGVVKIPAINLKAPVFNGVTYDVLEYGPGHWPGTPLPGERGNAVLSGHRTTYTHPFGDLNLLHKGDAVRFNLGKHAHYTYRIYRVALVPEAQYAHYVLKQPKNPKVRTVTMYACAPKGYHTYRIVAQARATHLPAHARSERGSANENASAGESPTTKTSEGGV